MRSLFGRRVGDPQTFLAPGEGGPAVFPPLLRDPATAGAFDEGDVEGGVGAGVAGCWNAALIIASQIRGEG